MCIPPFCNLNCVKDQCEWKWLQLVLSCCSWCNFGKCVSTGVWSSLVLQNDAVCFPTAQNEVLDVKFCGEVLRTRSNSEEICDVQKAVFIYDTIWCLWNGPMRICASRAQHAHLCGDFSCLCVVHCVTKHNVQLQRAKQNLVRFRYIDSDLTTAACLCVVNAFLTNVWQTTRWVWISARERKCFHFVQQCLFVRSSLLYHKTKLQFDSIQLFILALKGLDNSKKVFKFLSKTSQLEIWPQKPGTSLPLSLCTTEVGHVSGEVLPLSGRGRGGG